MDGETEDERKTSDDEPFSALAFKIMNDPYVGSLTFLRIYSGTLKHRRQCPKHRQRQERARWSYADDACQ